MFSQGSSAIGLKKAKLESWERSVGTLGGGGALGSLVVRKKAAATGNKPSPVVAAAASTSQTGSMWYLLLHVWGHWERNSKHWQMYLGLVFSSFLDSQNVCELKWQQSSCVLFYRFKDIYDRFHNCNQTSSHTEWLIAQPAGGLFRQWRRWQRIKRRVLELILIWKTDTQLCKCYNGDTGLKTICITVCGPLLWTLILGRWASGQLLAWIVMSNPSFVKS